MNLKSIICSSLLALSLAALSLAIVPGSASALNVGDTAPDFTVTSSDGKPVKLSDYQGKVVVLEWFNEGCPFVQKHYTPGAMQKLQTEYTGKDVVWLTINSTGTEHRDYLSPEKTKAVAAKWNIKSSAMLLDADGKVGKAYGAKTTPNMYVINNDGKLAYQGAIDDNNSPTSDPSEAKNYVKESLNSLLTGGAVAVSETKPYGCAVKYAI